MSDEDTSPSEKPFEPTPHKLQEARRKGDGPKSTDLTTAASYCGLLLGAATLSVALADAPLRQIASLLAQPDRIAAAYPLDSEANAALLRTTLAAGTLLFVGLIALPLLFSLVALGGQRALTFAPTKLEPKISRISPASIAKQKFGPEGLFEFAKSATKLTVICALLIVYSSNRAETIAGLTGAAPPLAAQALMAESLRFFAFASIAALVIALPDAIWQHISFLRRNRMTRTEITDETKAHEGDPAMKHRRRQMGQDLAGNRMLADVPEASVVVVNPTHYAAALKWDPKSMRAPVLLAKGTDEIAARIREIARENGIPIWRDPPSARALHATVEIGAEIAPSLYGAVAAAIRYADEVRAMARGGRRG